MLASWGCGVLGGVSLASLLPLCGCLGATGGEPAETKAARPTVTPVVLRASAPGAEAAVDGDWRSEWTAAAVTPGQPLELALDLGARRRVHGFVYVPAAYTAEGRLQDYAVSGSRSRATAARSPSSPSGTRTAATTPARCPRPCG